MKSSLMALCVAAALFAGAAPAATILPTGSATIILLFGFICAAIPRLSYMSRSM